MYRMRFHGRGGQGMKTASQILGAAFFREGFEVQDAPRYGAERRGAPVFAYVRAAHEPINERGVITRPDLVIVADETLIPVPAAAVLQGVSPRTVLLISSTEPVDLWRQRLSLQGPILPLPASTKDGVAPAHVSAICAGAAARLTGVIGRDKLAQAIRDELPREGGATIVEANLREGLAAFDALASSAGLVSEGGQVAAEGYAAPDWVDMPFDEARIAAPSIHASLTSELANTGVWRTLRPVIDDEHCSRCTWICSTFCPESAIKVGTDHRPSIDYDHCKGCLVCVAVCPPHAIRAVDERAAKEQAV